MYAVLTLFLTPVTIVACRLVSSEDRRSMDTGQYLYTYYFKLMHVWINKYAEIRFLVYLAKQV